MVPSYLYGIHPSNRVNSYLRVLLRPDRKKIEMALNDVHWYSISTGEKIDAAAAMDKLEKRLVVTETLDGLRRRFEVVSTWAPPSATDLIDQTLEAAAGRLRGLDLSDDDVAAANNLVQQMREDIYESDVLDEIKKHHDQKDQIVRIAYDTMRAPLPARLLLAGV